MMGSLLCIIQQLENDHYMCIVTSFLTAALKVFVNMEVYFVTKTTIKNGKKQLSGMGIAPVFF